MNEAAQFVAKYINVEPKKLLASTAIPAMLHQTWWSTKAEDFSEESLIGIEKWLGYATDPKTNMAYFMWTDDSVKKLIMSVDEGFKYRGEKVALVDVLPKPVEIADVFRVVVCNKIGGVVSIFKAGREDVA
jgi:mannosyltransferase OCH1-like enzyme